MAGEGGRGGSKKEGAPNVKPGTGRPKEAWRSKPKEPLYDVGDMPEFGWDPDRLRSWWRDELFKAYKALVANTDHRNAHNTKHIPCILESIVACLTRRPKELAPDAAETGTEVTNLTEGELERIINSASGSSQGTAGKAEGP